MRQEDEARLQRYRRQLEQTLRRQPRQMPELCKQYLRNNVAKSLDSVTESTFQETMGVNFADLFKTLQKLDGDIYELQVMQKLPNARKSLYEKRARYLTMVVADREFVKRMASELFSSEQLEGIRRYVSDFLPIGNPLSLSFDEFREFFRSHRLETEPESVKASERPPSPTVPRTASHQEQRPGTVESESPQALAALLTRLLSEVIGFFRWFSRLSFWQIVGFVLVYYIYIFLISPLTSVARFVWSIFVRVFNVGFCKKHLSPNLKATTALDLLRVSVEPENESKELLPVDEVIVSKFAEYIFQESREKSSLIKEIETVIKEVEAVLEEDIPNANYAEYAQRFCEKIVETFKSKLQDEKSGLTTIQARTSVFSLGRLALSPALPPWALFWLPLLASVLVFQTSGGVSWFLWLFIGLFSVMSALLGTVSFFRARRQLRELVEQELEKLVSELVERTIKSTASHVMADWVSQAVEDIDVQLRSRPLHRIRDGLLE